MAPSIDAHQHFWRLDLPFNYGWLDAPANAPIRRDYLPEDLAPLIAAAGVDRTVFVQTQHDVAENRWALDDWRPHFRAAASFPNVSCKLSGLVTEADWRAWTVADLKPYVAEALEQFGPDRLMFGSDWPVCELAGSYGQVRDALVEALG